MDQFQQELSSYFSNEDQFPSCVNLFGQKSNCLHKFLSLHKDQFVSVVVFANECYTNKILFETIINALNKHQLSEENNYTPYADADTIEEFLSELSLMDPDKSYLIAIENAEKLRDMELNIIPVFTKLQEFTGLNVSCVFVSHIPLSKFGVSMCHTIHVPDHTKADLIEMLSSKCSNIQKKISERIKKNQDLKEEEKDKQLSIIDQLDEDFYKRYLDIFLNVLYKVCRDTAELQFLAEKCYPSYYTPVLKGKIMVNDAVNLWRNITKVFKVLLQTSHMRIENQESSMEPTNGSSLSGFAKMLELPYYAKYLLIASFLASHNEAKFDKRLFMKHHGKEKKRQKIAKVSEKMNVQFGPKSFTIDRLLAIFYAILEEKVGLTCNLLSQVSTLLDLNFLTVVSGENSIMEGNTRLQSTIGLDFAINIGKVVGFNVKQFLTDFH